MYTGILLTFISYVLGSIPSGVILSKILKKPDLRKNGSYSIGATNALRTGGKLLGALTLFMDCAKGFVTILIVKIFKVDFEAFYGFICIFGNIFPIWFKFKGGKGVATSLGIILGIYPIFAILLVLLWILIFNLFRISSLASLISLGVSIFAVYTMTDNYINAIFLVMSFILVLLSHKSNIVRLYRCEENKIPK